ncbi:hypothetical protein B1748_28190 [Paenibacillus sp. MY03]|uniref:Ig-like domain-containing protein n=1 Tax=Paenibacillus sp. MY03 TaxID=302980 RepID=UPI000B3CD866|nr:Ig-like domain-containing protein [Paenibacillus sp. MY03]OUS70627.1 hypothetical protein B1748_28190 [Paenibacillus sp. MY03]
MKYRFVSKLLITVLTAGLIFPVGAFPLNANMADGAGTAPASVDALPVLFEDDADNMQQAGWTLSKPPESGVYATDASRSLGNPNLIEMKQVDPGQYLFYGDKQASDGIRYTMMTKSVAIGEGEWTLEFSARIVDLVKPKQYPAERGILFVVYANEKRYQIAFNAMNKLYGLTNTHGTTFQDKEIEFPQDNAFHQWEITFDGLQTVSVKLDGIKVAAFSGIALPATGRNDSVVIGNLPLDWEAGTNEVYFDYFKLYKGNPDVYAQDDAHSLADAGWTRFQAPIDGLYITDSGDSLGNPNGAAMQPVPAGQYLFYGDQRASGLNKYSYISQSMPIGAGAWELEFSAKFSQLMTPSRYLAERGIFFDVRANQKRYKIAFNSGNRIVAQVGSGSAVDVREVNMPNDDLFHSWKIAYDGVNAVSVSVDGVVLARFENIAGTVNAADGLYIFNAPLDWEAGANEVYFEDIRLSKSVKGNPNVLIDDEGSGFPTMNWQVDPPAANAYFTDYRKTNGVIAGMKPAAEGTYATYAAAGSGQAAQLSKQVAIAGAPWALEFDARIQSLVELDAAAGDPSKGLGLEIVADGKLYRLVWHDGEKLRLLKADGGYETLELTIPDAQQFHQWGIAYDRHQIIVSFDGMKLGSWQGLGMAQTGPDRVRIYNDATGAVTGTTEAAIDRIRLVKNALPDWAQFAPAITSISILPASSQANGIETVVSIDDANPLSYQDGSLQVEASLRQNGSMMASKLQAATGPAVSVRLDAVAATGRMELTVRLLHNGAELTTYTRNLEVYPTVEALAPGQQATVAGGTATTGAVYLYKAMTDVWDETANMVFVKGTSGWETAAYQYEGTEEGGVFLENVGDAHTLSLPINLNGWFGVYVGYVTGTEQFIVSDGTLEQTVTVGGSAIDPGQSYGNKAIAEVFAFASEFQNGTVTLKTAGGKQARIAYVKLKELTADEIALYMEADETALGGGKRVIYNNDGYSDFTSGLYADETKLKEYAVDLLAGQDAEAIYWSLGATMMIIRDSETALKPYTNLTPEQEDLMRSDDVRGMNLILQLINSGKDPLALVAGRAEELGMNGFASLRMNAFYNPGEHPYLNGPRYDEFVNKGYWQQLGDGSRSFRMSYAYPEFRQFVKDVLVEAAFATNDQGEQVVSGVELDFNRYPDLFGSEAASMSTATIMTDFLRELRIALPGKRIAVRVPYYPVTALDLQTWIADGLIDILIPASIDHEGFFSNIDEFADLAEGTNVKLYGGITGTLSGHEMTKIEEELKKRGIPITAGFNYVSKQQYLLRAHQFYEAGYDGIYIYNNWRGTAANGGVIRGELGDKVKVRKWHTFAYPAEWTQDSVYVEGAPRSLLFNDDAASLKDKSWRVTAPQPGVYITDSANTLGNPQGVALKPVTEGQYLIYGDGNSGGKWGSMLRNLAIGQGPWKMEYSARFADLMTPANYLPDRGILFRVNANGLKYVLAFNSYDPATGKAKVTFRGDQAYRNVGTYPIQMPNDDQFHAWEIRYDGESAISLWLDGVKIAEHAGMGFADPNPEHIEIASIPLDRESGTNELYIDHIRFSKIFAATGIELTPAELELREGEDYRLTVALAPDHATDKRVLWTSDNEEAATVDQAGRVVAISPGLAHITATAIDGGWTATSAVTVNAAPVPASISFAMDADRVAFGQQAVVTGAVYDAEGAGMAGITVRLSASSGMIDPAEIATGEDGAFSALFQAPNHAGSVQVTAVIPGTDVAGQVAVQVCPAVQVRNGQSLPEDAQGNCRRIPSTG